MKTLNTNTYSSSIADYWKNYLSVRQKPYEFNEETGTITCKLYSEELGEDTDFVINIDNNNFRICVKLPLSLEEDDLESVSDFLLGSSNYILYSRFILDYDAKALFCASSVFCGGNAPTDETVTLAFCHLDLSIDCLFEDLKCFIFKNRIARIKK